MSMAVPQVRQYLLVAAVLLASVVTPGECVITVNGNRFAYCHVHGDPHYVTFDHLGFSYQGVCKYNLASVISGSTLPRGFSEFNVYSRSEWRPHWEPGVSLAKYVEIVIGGSTVRIYRSLSLVTSGAAIPAALTIDGVPASIPYKKSFDVFYNGLFVYLETTFGVTVVYNGNRDVVVLIPKVQYDGLLEGLCGNNDGNLTNDWTLADGTSIAGRPDGTTLGESFVIPDDPEIDPNFPCPLTSGRRRRNLPEQPVTPLNPQNPCIPVPPAHHAGCNILVDTTGLFSDCINAIGLSVAQIYYNNCLFDACFSNGASICDSIMAFVSLCQQIGSTVSCQDFLSTPCADQCPAGMTFQCAISSCPATCAVPDAPQMCTRPMIDSCACPSGQFLLDGRCTVDCPIGCVDSALQYREVGTSWRGTGCTVYTCESEGRITQSTCLRNEICIEETCVPDERLSG